MAKARVLIYEGSVMTGAITGTYCRASPRRRSSPCLVSLCRCEKHSGFPPDYAAPRFKQTDAPRKVARCILHHRDPFQIFYVRPTIDVKTKSLQKVRGPLQIDIHESSRAKAYKASALTYGCIHDIGCQSHLLICLSPWCTVRFCIKRASHSIKIDVKLNAHMRRPVYRSLLYEF